MGLKLQTDMPCRFWICDYNIFCHEFFNLSQSRLISVQIMAVKLSRYGRMATVIFCNQISLLADLQTPLPANLRFWWPAADRYYLALGLLGLAPIDSSSEQQLNNPPSGKDKRNAPCPDLIALGVADGDEPPAIIVVDRSVADNSDSDGSSSSLISPEEPYSSSYSYSSCGWYSGGLAARWASTSAIAAAAS